MTTKKFTYAAWHERMLANLLDALILLVPGLLLRDAHDTTIGPLTMVMVVLNTAYYTAFLASRWQATPGQRLLHIYVIHANRSPLTMRDALERYLAYILPVLPLYTSLLSENTATLLAMWLSLLWFIPILTTPERTGIHDKICKTRVIKGRADAG